MAVGQNGVDGPHALKPVEPVFKCVLEAARIQNQNMAGDFALAWRVIRGFAEGKHALVKINVASLSGNTVLFFHERSYSWFRWNFFKTACSRNALTIRHDDRFDSQKAFLLCFMLSLICVFSLLFVLLVFCLFICFVCLFFNFFLAVFTRGYPKHRNE